MTTTTRRARPWHLLLVPILALAAMACPPAEPETSSAMLADLEPSPSDEDRIRNESAEPLPMPEEPTPWATPDDVRPAARLIDLESLENDASRSLAAAKEPSPMPEEPRPDRKGKKGARE